VSTRAKKNAAQRAPDPPIGEPPASPVEPRDSKAFSQAATMSGIFRNAATAALASLEPNPIGPAVTGPAVTSEISASESGPVEEPAPPIATGGTESARRTANALGTQVEIHDHEQLEVRVDYGIGSDVIGQRYQVDAYFFVPRNVGVNRGNYPREDFYADVTALMRLDAVALPLERLASTDDPASPLFQLAQALVSYRTSPRPPPSQSLVVPVKLYAYLFGEAVKAESKRLRQMCRRLEAGDEAGRKNALDELGAALGRIKQGLWAYRNLRGAFWPFEQLCHHSFVEAMRTADEFMSLFLEERLAMLVEAIAAMPHLYDGSGFVARARQLVTAVAAGEDAYRAKFGYLRFAHGAPHGGEFFTYGTSYLKKAVHQALYLDFRSVKNQDLFFRNAVAAVAAALGAIWAFATQLPATLANLPATTQALLFFAAVGAYVTKDRIKALANEFLTSRLRKHDHAFWLQGTSLSAVGLGMLRIRLREAMRYLTSSEVPESVLRQRLSRRTLRRAEAFLEEVIHYRKELDLTAEDEALDPPEGYRLRDILRINLRHFLVRLDEPIDRVAYYDTDKHAFAWAELPKVYHLNLVLELKRVDKTKLVQERIEHLRVVLNKNGIVRVEKVRTAKT